MSEWPQTTAIAAKATENSPKSQGKNKHQNLSAYSGVNSAIFAVKSFIPDGIIDKQAVST